MLGNPAFGTIPGTRVTLEAFLRERAPEIAGELTRAAEDIARVTAHLGTALGRHPELATQVARLAAAVPQDVATLEAPERNTAITEAERLAEDVKARWISADDPPMVDEIDDRLAEIHAALQTLRRPGPEALRATAADIDRLARSTAHLDGIERGYIPWALGTGLLFVLGLAVFFFPALLDDTALASPWTILICLGALPATGLHYHRRVLPRTRTDTAIDALNRDHFVPLGGLYFPAGEIPACVVIIAPARERSEGDQARAERRGHKDKMGPFW